MTVATTIAELNQLLADTSITALTLSTPAETITLHREPNPLIPSSPGVTRQSRPSNAALTVSAPCSGMFLHRHPLREAPLVRVGQAVQAGAVVGLLQVGPLLLQITAPHAGIVASVAAEAVVGYGSALVHLAEEER